MQVTNRKVVVVGTGFVGTSIAYSMINQGIVNDLVLIDVNQEKAEGEALDLLDGIAWGQENVNRLELVDTNAKIMKSIVNEVMKSGFDGVFVIASNPVDVLTYCAWKASGLPASRVVGTGTTLDTTRFRKELATKLEMDPRSIHGYIIGEHGDSEVAVWSHTTVGGKPILEFIVQNNRLEVADLQILSDKVKNAAYEIIDRKKATYYGIGMSTARIVKAILNNEQAVLPVSAYLEGQYGEEGIFTGVPSVVNQTGVREIIDLNIDAYERKAFKNSVKQLREVIQSLESQE